MQETFRQGRYKTRIRKIRRTPLSTRAGAQRGKPTEYLEKSPERGIKRGKSGL